MPYQYSFFLNAKPLPANRKARYLTLCDGYFRRIPALGHKGFKFGFHEGYKDHSFGLISGPMVSVNAVVHDLAHIVEFGDKQFRKRGQYGFLQFHIPQKFIYNRFCQEPVTGQASHREARTMGIELRLYEMMGVAAGWDEALRKMVSTLRHMPDWIHHHKKPRPLMIAMYQGYMSCDEATINRRLNDWFESIVRQEYRKNRKAAKHQIGNT